MLRLRSNTPGPGQGLARRGIRLSRAIFEAPGASVSIHWISGHAGVKGNELADVCAGEAARGGICRGLQPISLTFLRAQRS